MDPQLVASITASVVEIASCVACLVYANRSFDLQWKLFEGQMQAVNKPKKGSIPIPVPPRPSMMKGNVLLIGVIALCVCLSWVPYLTSSQAIINSSDIIKSWGGGIEHGVIGTVVDSSYLKKDGDKYAIVIVCVLQSSMVDDLENTLVVKSSAFSITGGDISILIVPSLQFWQQAQLMGRVGIMTYMVELPKDISPEKISKLADVNGFGGKIVAHEGWGGRIEIPSLPAEPEHHKKD